MIPWCFFDSTIQKVGSINIILKHLLLEITNKKLSKKKLKFDCYNKSCIWGFGNA